MAAAAEEELFDFEAMTEDELRQWVDANPGRVNDWDDYDVTPSTPVPIRPSTARTKKWLK